jgi:hypothetical protein
MIIDVGKLERDYVERRPDVNDPNQLVSFGTSGHRGSPFEGTFTEAELLPGGGHPLPAYTQAQVANARGGWQDSGQQQLDRSGR